MKNQTNEFVFRYLLFVVDEATMCPPGCIIHLVYDTEWWLVSVQAEKFQSNSYVVGVSDVPTQITYHVRNIGFLYKLGARAP